MTTAERLIVALKDIATPITGDSCHLCGKKEWESQPTGYSVIVQQCEVCRLPSCDECSTHQGFEYGAPKPKAWTCEECDVRCEVIECEERPVAGDQYCAEHRRDAEYHRGTFRGAVIAGIEGR